MDSAQYLQVYDVNLIHSWTLNEYKNFIKGARLREVDRTENAAISAVFNARAANGKMTVKKLFDAQKVRDRIISMDTKKPQGKDLRRFHAAQAAMKNYHPQKIKKGG